MKALIESYIGVWFIMFLMLLALAFTCINMNVAQARKILSDIKAEVQASNGAIVPKDTGVYTSSSSATLEDNGYTWDCNITRQSMLIDGAYEDGETFMYNNIYKISFKYEYYVPLFGRQIYPIETFAY